MTEPGPARPARTGGAEIEAYAPDGIGEVTVGTDLAVLVVEATGSRPLRDGDVVVITSKAVSKAEGRVVEGTRDDAITAQTVRVVARKGPTSIVRTPHGLTMAAAGVDASNVAAGSLVLLPADPDGSACRLREALLDLTGANVAVLVTDTAGRAWREGQTDMCIGAAGLTVLEDFAGRIDAYGNELAVTAPAVADELAGLAELATGKLGGRPLTVVRGRADLVRTPGDHGPGARALVRPETGDLFGFGAREAVVVALSGGALPEGADARAGFGAPASLDELCGAVLRVTGQSPRTEGGVVVAPGLGPVAAGVLAFAHGWEVVPEDDESATGSRLRPRTP